MYMQLVLHIKSNFLTLCMLAYYVDKSHNYRYSIFEGVIALYDLEGRRLVFFLQKKLFTVIGFQIAHIFVN